FLEGPPADLHLADDVLLRHGAPVAAVGAVVPGGAHDEVEALLDHLRAPVVVAPKFGGNVIVVEGDVVDVDAAVYNPHRIALPGDDALHEHLFRVERVVEHHDVAGPRLADFVDELVDDQAIVIFERRRHAQAIDPRDLKTERDNQGGVDRG